MRRGCAAGLNRTCTGCGRGRAKHQAVKSQRRRMNNKLRARKHFGGKDDMLGARTTSWGQRQQGQQAGGKDDSSCKNYMLGERKTRRRLGAGDCASVKVLCGGEGEARVSKRARPPSSKPPSRTWIDSLTLTTVTNKTLPRSIRAAQGGRQRGRLAGPSTLVRPGPPPQASSCPFYTQPPWAACADV
eukprot:352398-Chlamydomonas_euryale.AAC.3